MNIETKFANRSDVEAWFGGPTRWTLRGARLWTADGAPAALAGYYAEGGRAVVFCEIRLRANDVRRCARHVLRGARAILADVRRAGLPACAVADPAWPSAERLLGHLGFAPAGPVWVRL